MAIGARNLASWIAVLVPALFAAGLVWRATAAGLVFTPDGVPYLEAARSFSASGALWVRTECGRSHAWMTALAPFYSVILGLGAKAGWEPFAWARVLNAICAAAIAGALSWSALLQSDSPIAAFLAGIAAATLPDALNSERSMLSEALCIALTLTGWLLLRMGRSKEGGRLIWCSAVPLGLAAVTRFDTLLLVVPAAVCVWLATRRRRTVATFAAVWLLPSALLSFVNRIFAGGASPRTFAVHFPPFRLWEEAAKTMAAWAGAGAIRGVAAFVLVSAALAAIAVAVSRSRRYAALLAAGFLFTYLATLAAARFFVDITIDLGEPRHLLPSFYFVILALASILPRRLLIPLLCVLPLVHLRTALRPADVGAQYNSNHPSWRTSETLAAASDLAARGVCVHSNAPDVVYRRSGTPSEWLPQRVEWFTARPEPWCETARRIAADPQSAFVFFDARLDPESSVASQSELLRCLGRVREIRLSDGSILLPSP